MSKKDIKVYIAGKVSKDSVFNTGNWRSSFCKDLEEHTGLKIVNLDPTRTDTGYELNENDANLIFGRDSFFISIADLVIVYLTDDISVGGSQEMLIAKYYSKPLIGIVPRNSKFRKSKLIGNRFWHNWTHPFVKVSCDYLVEDFDSLSRLIINRPWESKAVKGINIIDKSVNYYKTKFSYLDNIVHKNKIQKFIAQKAVVIDKDLGLLAIKYSDTKSSKKVRGKYSFPGGRLSSYDNPDEALVRRVQEETGVFIEPTNKSFGTYSWQYSRGGYDNIVLALTRRAKYKNGEIKTPDRKEEIDLDRACWLPIDKIDVNSFVADEQFILQTALANI